jgi:hypothetical protein
MPYLGKTPSQATRKRYYKTASGSETSISGTMTVGGTLTFTDGEFVDVSVNGVALVAGTDYNTDTANTIAGLSALSANDQVEIVVYDTFSVFSGDVDSNMSVGGNLSVTGTATLTGNADFNGDLDVDGTTNLDVVDIDGAVDMATTLAVGGVVTANAGVVVDNITIDGTEIDLSSGNLTLDVAGQIILDADTQGSGNGVLLKDDGTLYGSIFRSSSDLHIKSEASDEDMIFMGNDGGSEITALTFDMSEAGFATFNASATIPGIINVGSVGASGGTAGEIAFGGVGGSIDGFRIRNTQGNYLELSAVSSGNSAVLTNTGVFLVGKTSDSIANNGISLAGSATGGGFLSVTNDGNACATFNRKSSSGDIITFSEDGSKVGAIGSNSGQSYFFTANDAGCGIAYGSDNAFPSNGSGALSDNSKDLGGGATRWDDVFATNGTIQTSDENEKQDIASLTSAEITAAKAISKLFKTFKWKDKVVAKGDAARTHTGVIAQEVQAAMSAAGLDATKYAFWCSDTWWETSTDVAAVAAVEEKVDEDGNLVTRAVEAKDAYTRIDTYDTEEEAPEGATKRTRLGVRYPELLAFIGAATEQRLADIEARIAKLENA